MASNDTQSENQTDRLRQIWLTSSRLKQVVLATHLPDQAAANTFAAMRTILQNMGARLHGQIEGDSAFIMQQPAVYFVSEFDLDNRLTVSLADVRDLEYPTYFRLTKTVYDLRELQTIFNRWYQLLSSPPQRLDPVRVSEDSIRPQVTVSSPEHNVIIDDWEDQMTRQNRDRFDPTGVAFHSILTHDPYQASQLNPPPAVTDDFFAGSIVSNIIYPPPPGSHVALFVSFQAPVPLGTVLGADNSNIEQGSYEFLADHRTLDHLAQLLDNLIRFIEHDRSIHAVVAREYSPFLTELENYEAPYFPATVWMEDENHNQLRIKSTRIRIENNGAQRYQTFPVVELVPAMPSTPYRSLNCVLSLPHLYDLREIIRHWVYRWHAFLWQRTEGRNE